MRVAAIQFAPTLLEYSLNIRRLVRLVTKAAQGGAKLAVCPELSTSGYSMMNRTEAATCAEVLGDYPVGGSLYAMRKVASDFGIAIVWGLVVRDPGCDKLYNAQVYIDPKGYTESYFKINKWGNDALWADSGRANPPVINCEVTGKRVGLLICRDIRDKKNDDWTNFYSRGDADIVAFSTAWGVGGFPSTTWLDFVESHGMTLVVANRYGDEGDMPNRFGGGGSCIITPECTPDRPSGVHCDGLVFNQDCIVYAEIP